MATSSDGSKLAGKERERYVESLFDQIALPYDRLNRVISMGRDESWRRRVVELMAIGPGSHVVDVGTGTGDLAFTALRSVVPGGAVLGVDLSFGMLAGAVAKQSMADVSGIHFVRGNASNIPVADSTVDAVSMGWCLRNVGDRPAAYAAILAALKPGGRFVTVDMSRPRFAPVRAGFWLYRHTVMPAIARLSGGATSAYRYLATSTDRFPDGPTLAEELRTAGFEQVRHVPLMMGSLAIHVGQKPV